MFMCKLTWAYAGWLHGMSGTDSRRAWAVLKLAMREMPWHWGKPKFDIVLHDLVARLADVLYIYEQDFELE